MDPRVMALRSHFGLSNAPPVVFRGTPQGKVWGLSSGRPAYASVLHDRIEIRPGVRVRTDFAQSPAPVSASRARAQQKFIDWLGRAYPEALAAMVDALAAAEAIENGDGLGQDESPGFGQRLMDMAQTILPAYLQYEQQSDILNVQLDRARQGLPPLNTGEYAASMQIGLDQETVRRIANEAATRAQGAAGAMFRSPMTWVALGVGALGLFMLMNRPKRRR